MKQLRRVYLGLLCLLPVSLFFSYYPLLSLGSNQTMNFELSIPLLCLVLFDLVALITLLAYGSPRLTKAACISDRKIFLLALFPLYATLSIFWSANTLRATLTAGVLWLVVFAMFAILYITPLLQPSRRFWRGLFGAFFGGTIAVCVFCWAQCLLDIIGVPREQTLLCAGCTYRTFGFPHPSGFAIEPQFMGNLLLAPTLLVLYLLVFQTNPNNRKLRYQLTLLAVFFASSLFLTLSRGAIYAFVVALVILLAYAVARRRQWWRVLVLPMLAFALTLTAQGILAAASPTVDTFASGTTKVIHQLSLGIVDLRPSEIKEAEEAEEDEDEAAEAVAEAEEMAESGEAAAVVEADSGAVSTFDGYIPASTNVRLGLSNLALQTWASSPYYVFFGVGLGGAGVAMHDAFPTENLAQPNAIVQNQAISLLLELGIFGIALLALALVLIFVPGRFLKGLCLSRADTTPKASLIWRSKHLPLLVALIVAYLVTLNFFAGLPNALQVYLMLPILVAGDRFLVMAKS